MTDRSIVPTALLGLVLNSASGAEDAAGGLRPLAADAAPLALGEPTPDAELLAVLEGELEALLRTTHPRQTSFASRGGTPLGEEEVGIDAEAVGLVLPAVIPGSARIRMSRTCWRTPCRVVPCAGQEADGDTAVITSM